jgi:hypothetical protein
MDQLMFYQQVMQELEMLESAAENVKENVNE